MIINRNLLRKNQVIIYTVALMLVTAGYLNYTSNISKNAMETSSQEIVQEELIQNDAEQKQDLKQEEASKKDDNLVPNEVEKTNKVKNKNESIEESELDVADIGDATLVSSSDVVTDYFASSKLSRDSMYSQMIESYEKILNSSNSSESQKQIATQEITKINDVKNKIMVCENLIAGKGFKNCVVFVNDESVSVVVGADKLKPEEIAQIQNIVSREVKAKIEDIHISSK